MLADKPFVSQELESGRGTRSGGSLRGLSDRTIAWLFILPTILLLLAINIFPLIWALRLSFTNFKSNMPSVPARFIGIDNYIDILTDANAKAKADEAKSSGGKADTSATTATPAG